MGHWTWVVGNNYLFFSPCFPISLLPISPFPQCPFPHFPNAQCPIPNPQCPIPNSQCPMPNPQLPIPNYHYFSNGKVGELLLGNIASWVCGSKKLILSGFKDNHTFSPVFTNFSDDILTCSSSVVK